MPKPLIETEDKKSTFGGLMESFSQKKLKKAKKTYLELTSRGGGG